MKCKYCYSEIEEDALFCPYCGKKVETIAKCVKCGETLDDDSAFCPYCGANQKESIIDNEQLEIDNGTTAEQEDKVRDGNSSQQTEELLDNKPNQDASQETPEKEMIQEEKGEPIDLSQERPSSKYKLNLVAVLLIIIVGCAISSYFICSSHTVESEVDTTTIVKQKDTLFSENPDLILFELHGPVKEADYSLDGRNVHLCFDEAGKLLSIDGRSDFLISSDTDFWSPSGHQDEFVFKRDEKNRLIAWLNKHTYISGKYTWAGNSVISCEFGGESEADCYTDEYSYDRNRRLTKVIRTAEYTDYEEDTVSTTTLQVVFQIKYDEYDKHGNWISRHSECSYDYQEYWQKRQPEKRSITYYDNN